MFPRFSAMDRLTLGRWNSGMTILVLGGNGKTGRRVAARLGTGVRLGSRAGSPPFDWSLPETWGPVVDGVSSVYVTYQPDLAFPGAASRVGEFARVAVSAGVRRLVLLSGRGEAGAQAAEALVASAGAEWAVVRSAFFMQNFTEDFLAGPVFALPAGSVAEPFVDAEDVADVAVAALLGRIPLGRVYELTGPRALTFASAAALLGVSYVPVSEAEFVAGSGLPVPVAEPLGALFAEVLDGRNTAVASGVADALGRAPRSFEDFAAAVTA
jgi:uncharacterized protein YbjT (DUF2867 family)